MSMRNMFVLKEPRLKEGKKEGKSKTVWNRIGVMFRNEASDKKEESFDILFDAHPIGKRACAFKSDSKTKTPAVRDS